MSLPRDLTPESVIALIDTREKKPFDLSPLRMEAASLATGDYSVKGLEDYIAVERKSLADLVLCVGRERDRFERACQRMMAYPVKAIVIEASFRDLEGGQWRGRVSPNAVTGSVLGWMARGLPIVMGQDSITAARMISRLLYIATRRRYREIINYCDMIEEQHGPQRTVKAPPKRLRRNPGTGPEIASPPKGDPGQGGTP